MTPLPAAMAGAGDAGARLPLDMVIHETDVQLGEPIDGGGVFRGRWLSQNRDVAVLRLAADLGSAIPKEARKIQERVLRKLWQMATASIKCRHVCEGRGACLSEAGSCYPVLCPASARHSVCAPLRPSAPVSLLLGRRLLGFMVRDGHLHVVMPLLEGGSLAQRIAERGAGLRADEVVDLAVQLLEGLQDLHHHGVTPRNVLVDEGGKVLLLDNGLVSVVEGAMGLPVRGEADGHRKASVTTLLRDVASALLAPFFAPQAPQPRPPLSVTSREATAHFMPPEWWDPSLGPLTAASDAYSVAATLCCAASGRPPYGDKHKSEVMRDVLELRRFPEVPRSVPEPLRSALQGALRERPGDRTSVAGMLRAANRSK